MRPREQPLRILEVLVTTDLGGGPKQVYDLVRHLPPDEFDIVVAGPRGTLFERFRGLGVRTEELDAASVSMDPLLATIRMIRRLRVDVVHTHGKGAGLYGRLAARLTRVPAIHTFHGIHYRSYSRLGQVLYLWLERRLSRLTHTVINVSPSQAAEGLALGLFTAAQSVTVPNGVDIEALDGALSGAPVSRESLGLAPGDLVVGCVTRFDPVKRLEILVRAFAQLAREIPQVMLLLVGGGQEEAAIRRTVAARGLGSRVIFTGFVGQPLPLYGVMDLYVVTSLKEGLPGSLMEAMAARVPVIATDVPGHRDVVVDGEGGILVPAEDPATLAVAMARVLHDPALRRRLGEVGRRRVEKHFALAPMVTATAEIYRRAVAGRTRW